MADQVPDDQILDPEGRRRRGTMKMATLALHNMLSQEGEGRRASRKDFISELMLPVSCGLLIMAICLSGNPALKSCAFVLPLCAFGYYIYRRIGVVATFDNRQAYLIWRLLISTFLFGGTFALFSVYVLAYISQLLMRKIP